MNDWMLLFLRWSPPIVQIVLLGLQIYTYRRTGHYSLFLLVVASVAGLLASGLARLLSSEGLNAQLRTGVFDAMVLSYLAYMVIGIWGAAALFRSYIRLTAANKVFSQTEAE
jgi:hypothetical protein